MPIAGLIQSFVLSVCIASAVAADDAPPLPAPNEPLAMARAALPAGWPGRGLRRTRSHLRPRAAG